MQASGLVEIASHSANLHHGIVANPQGNLIPAAIARAYDDGQYESYRDFHARIAADLTNSAEAREFLVIRIREPSRYILNRGVLAILSHQFHRIVP